MELCNMIRIAGFIALARIALASSNNASASTRRYDFSAIEAELARQCRSGDFSGVVLVRAQGRTVFEKECGEADIINHVPITRATRFRIYSTSKLMTALAVMRLVELHRIDLDGSIADYVPDVPVEWNPVTVRELLNHTSGIGDFTEQLLYHFRADHPSLMRLTLGALSRSERSLKSKPGQRFSYNNFGFELLADAGARVTGKPFATVVQELVFGPAGMATSSLQQPTIVDGHPVGMREKGLALGYNGSPSDLEQTIPFSFVQLGAGAVRAGAEDFVALDDAITSGKIVTPGDVETDDSRPRPPAGWRQCSSGPRIWPWGHSRECRRCPA